MKHSIGTYVQHGATVGVVIGHSTVNRVQVDREGHVSLAPAVDVYVVSPRGIGVGYMLLEEDVTMLVDMPALEINQISLDRLV